MKLFSRVRLFAAHRTVAYQAPPSMRFSRQEYWSGLPFDPSILELFSFYKLLHHFPHANVTFGNTSTPRQEKLSRSILGGLNPKYG